jgi:hypothetical protein
MDARVTQQDLKPGMVIRFQYELKAYKGKWASYCGIVLKNQKRLVVYCLHNGHNGVFSAKSNLRYIKQLEWSLV